MPKFVANDEIFAKLLVVKVLYKLVDTSLFVPCTLHFFLGGGEMRRTLTASNS